MNATLAGELKAPPLAFVGTCDLTAIVRGRAVPGRDQQKLLESGVGWVPADLGLTCFGGIADGIPFDSSGDLRLMPDLATRVDVPPRGDAPGFRMFLADQQALDGTVWECCPSRVLRQALEEMRERLKLEPLVSFEHEFVLTGTDDTHPFSRGRLRACEPFGSALLDLLDGVGLRPETWLPEYGTGQFEITLRPARGLEAADRAIILRELVRDLARSMGSNASFAPIASPGGVGSGVHIHLSLLSASGEPVLFERGQPGSLSELGAKFAAGVLAHSDALTAMTAASASSFLRLRPHRWSAAAAVLADRDREALVRICPIGSADDVRAASQLNLEYRAADATANPWLALGSLLRAGMTGINADYPPAEVVPVGGLRAALDHVRLLPTDQSAALAALEGDAVARGWFPADLLSAFLAVKRAELSAVEGLDDDDLCSRIAHAY